MKIRIEGSGHCVEIDCHDENRTVEQTAQLAEKIWNSTRVEEPRRSVGYGSQLVERTRDTPVHGNGQYQHQPSPVTA